ncbi:YhdP family protein [Pigmentiphaga soli]|uniref:YhdP family protein n=1 Tax=Pigmentiphaga soli TaxID=1007095 RepID=UPI0031EE8CF9
MRIDPRPFCLRVLRPVLWLLLAGYFLFAVTALVLRYLVLPSIDDYRPSIERLATRMAGTTVRIGDIGADWRGLNPRLELRQVSVLDAQGRTALALPRVDALFSWRSVLALEPRLLDFRLDAPELDVRRDAQGRIEIAGFPIDIDKTSPSSGRLRWLFAQRQIAVRGALLRWTDETRPAPPLELRNVELRLSNTGLHHRAALRADPPAGLAAPLDVRADFYHGLFEFDAGDPRRWSGTVYAAAPRLDLAGWRAWLDLPAGVERGAGALRAWVTLRQGRLTGAVADVALADAQLSLQSGLPPLALRSAATRIDAAHGRDGDRVALVDSRVETADGLALAPRSVVWQARRVEGQVAGGELQVSELDLTALEKLADRLPLPAAVRSRVEELAPSGMLQAFALEWRGAAPQLASASVAMRFSGLTLAAAPAPAGADAAHPRRPGFSNLSGSFEGRLDGGTLSIDARDAVLFFPGVFENPAVPLRGLTAQARYARGADGVLEVRLERFEFQRTTLSGEASGVWRGEGKGRDGTLDLTGRLARADMREIPALVPLVVGPHVRGWLRQALVAGTASDVSFRVRGDLHDFPFVDGKAGQFHVGGQVQGATLDYEPAHAGLPGWPRLEGVAGDWSFDGAAMTINARAGRIRPPGDAAIELGPTRVRIADMEHDPLLEVDGETRGPASAFLAFVQGSPVASMIGGALDGATATGAFVVPLSLRLQLARMAQSQVRGEVRLAGNDLRLRPELPPLQRLTGTVAFGNAGLEMRGVAGSLLGGPVRIAGGPQADGRDVLQIDGSASADGLRQLWPAPGMARLSGQAAYSARVVAAHGRPPAVTIQSDLAGLAIDLPAPLGKPAAGALPLRLEWDAIDNGAGGSGGDWLAGGLGDHVNLHVERDFDPGGAVRAVRAALGVNRPATLAGPGLGISADLPEIDVDQWRRIAAEFVPPADATRPGAGAGAGNGGAPGSAGAGTASAAAGSSGAAMAGGLPPLRRISLHTPKLRLFGRQFDDASLVALADPTSSVWRLDAESRQLAGRISWRDTAPGAAADAGRITARLSRLEVGDAGDGDASEPGSADPLGDDDADVPEIDLVVDAFRLYGKPLGRLDVLARRIGRDREWRLDRFSLANPDAQLEGSGVWRAEPGPQSDHRRLMTLNSTLTLNDAGRFLDRMGLPGTMAGGKGTLAARLSWRGLPYSLDLPSLAGSIDLSLDKGQFLKADPGIAKLLGVLSLQSLPRRVTLDFRDVFSEGFAYDTIRAHAGITGGVAHTDDFNMNGVNATVLIAGDTDLARESQNLRVVVVPKLDAGGASLLYGLVNPAVGLSVFLAQMLLKQPLSQAFTYQYAITGNWSDPHIERLPNATPAAPFSSAGGSGPDEAQSGAAGSARQ